MCFALVNSPSPYSRPIRVDTVTLVTLEGEKLRHREVDPGSLTLELTLYQTVLPLRGVIMPHFIDEETEEPRVTQ